MSIATSLEQSKKLLSLGVKPESADMVYPAWTISEEPTGDVCEVRKHDFESEYDIPCWSLTALLNLIPNEVSTGYGFQNEYQISIRKYDGTNNTTLYQIAYGNDIGLSGSWHDMINTGEHTDLIDCCVEMIEWLCKNGYLGKEEEK